MSASQIILASYATAPTNSDPYFSNVKLLIHGIDSIVDLSASPKSISSVGGVSLSGDGILFNDGYLQLANNAGFALGQNKEPFSIEADINTSTIAAGVGTIMAYSNGASQNSNFAYVMYRYNAGVQLTGVSGNAQSSAGAIGALAVNTWARVELSYDGTTFREFINGVVVRSSAPGYTNLNNPDGAILQIGKRQGSYPFAGKKKNIRITKGVVRNVANYTPSSGLFPAS